MRIVGLLLVSAMLVIPVACALQTARSFGGTIMQSMTYGILTVLIGLPLSYYANLAPGGTIILTGTALFLLSIVLGKRNVGQGPAPEHNCKVCEERKAKEARNEG